MLNKNKSEKGNSVLICVNTDVQINAHTHVAFEVK